MPFSVWQIGDVEYKFPAAIDGINENILVAHTALIAFTKLSAEAKEEALASLMSVYRNGDFFGWFRPLHLGRGRAPDYIHGTFLWTLQCTMVGVQQAVIRNQTVFAWVQQGSKGKFSDNNFESFEEMITMWETLLVVGRAFIKIKMRPLRQVTVEYKQVDYIFNGIDKITGVPVNDIYMFFRLFKDVYDKRQDAGTITEFGINLQRSLDFQRFREIIYHTGKQLHITEENCKDAKMQEIINDSMISVFKEEYDNETDLARKAQIKAKINELQSGDRITKIESDLKLYEDEMEMFKWLLRAWDMMMVGHNTASAIMKQFRLSSCPD
jgi:hypothetical protein